MNIPFQRIIQDRVYAYFLSMILCGWIPYAQSQGLDQFNADACESIYQLSPTHAQLHEYASSQWWFVPQASLTATSDSGVVNGLSLHAMGTEQNLNANNDTVFIRWHSKVADVKRWVVEQPYLIVRSDAPIRDFNGHPIGFFAHLVARASWDDRVQVAPNDTETNANVLMAPLRIEQVIGEVDQKDRVIPRVCLNAKTVEPNDLPNPIRVAKKAQVLGLVHSGSMAAQNALAVMDKGAIDGIRTGQIWFLAEAMSPKNTNPLSLTRSRGQAKVIEVFDHYALIRIQKSEREVMRGSYLTRSIRSESSSIHQ